MSRVAEGHFRRKREALYIEGKHVTIQGRRPGPARPEGGANAGPAAPPAPRFIY